MIGSLYSEQRTWLHDASAGVKLAFLAAAGVFLFATERWEVLLACTAICALVVLSLGPAAHALWRGLRALAIACALIAALHAWWGQTLVGVASALRLLCAVALGMVMTSTTRVSDLLELAQRMLAPLQSIGIRSDRLALQVALMLRFTAHFFEQWQRLNDAHRARTGRAGGVRLLAPMTIHMLLATRRVADALALRVRD